MRRTVLLVAVPAVLAGGVAAAVLVNGRGQQAQSSQPLPPATAAVTRGTLTETEEVDGTLGYGEATTVNGRLPGTVTALPAPGATVQRGQAVYHVDGTPVVLLYGAQPLYRRLAPGVDGADVRLLEENLAALGYKGFTVDDSYSSATADAVERWQEALGLPETGTVEAARAVVASGPIRVSELRAHLGDQASGPILQYTGSQRLVSVDLDVTKQDLATVGAPATVELPNGTTVDATVASVGSVATAVTGNNQTTVTIEVVVTVADQSKLGRYDEAPVDVTLVSQEREDVLSVPVAALLALAEGGYGVQVVDGSQTRIVAVKTGLFARGRVEISGDGIAEGVTVGMPK